MLRALELPVPRQKRVDDDGLSRRRLCEGNRRRGGGGEPGCERHCGQCVVDRPDGALTIVRGKRAPGGAVGENAMLAVWRVGLHRRRWAVQEPRFRPLEGLLRLYDRPRLHRPSRRLEKRAGRLA